MNQSMLPTWDAQAKQIHIRKVVITMIILAIMIGLVIFGFTYPVCNSTQLRSFFSCKCAPGSALDTKSKLCKCLDTGTQLGGTCDAIAQDVRYVFSADLENTIDWTYTNDSPS